MSLTKENKRIYAALNKLMTACGFSGESGTEEFFEVLAIAIDLAKNDWDIVEEHCEDGLCFDVNGLLTDAICKALAVRIMDMDPGPATEEHPLQ